MFLNRDKNKKGPFGLGKVLHHNRGQPSNPHPPPPVVNNVSDSEDETPKYTPSAASDDEQTIPIPSASTCAFEITSPINEPKAPSYDTLEVRAPAYEAPQAKPQEHESLEGFLEGLSVKETPGIFHGHHIPSPNLPTLALKAGSLHKLPDLTPFVKTHDGLFKKPKHVSESQTPTKAPSLEKIFTEHIPTEPFKSNSTSTSSLIYKLTGSKEATPSKDSFGSILDALKPKAIAKAAQAPVKQLVEDTISLCGDDLDDSKGIQEIASDMIPTSVKEIVSEVINETPLTRGAEDETPSESSTDPYQQYFAHFLVMMLPFVSRLTSVFFIMSPLLWPASMVYSLFLVYDQAHKKGFRSSNAKAWSLGKAYAEYFPTSLQTETTLDPNRKYIFLYHNEANSDTTLAAFAAFTAQPTLSQNVYFMTPQEEFTSPLYREILYSSKMATNNNATIARILDEGHSCLIPTYDDPSAIDPDLLELACISGASLVPVYGYGDDAVFQPPTKIDDLLSTFMAVPSIYGKENKPTVTNPFPNKTPLDVIGIPIHPIIGELTQAVSQLQNVYTINAGALRLKHKLTA